MKKIIYICPNCNIIYNKNDKTIKTKDIKTIYKLEQKYCKLCSNYRKWELKEYG